MIEFINHHPLIVLACALFATAAVIVWTTLMALESEQDFVDNEIKEKEEQ